MRRNGGTLTDAAVRMDRHEGWNCNIFRYRDWDETEIFVSNYKNDHLSISENICFMLGKKVDLNNPRIVIFLQKSFGSKF